MIFYNELSDWLLSTDINIINEKTSSWYDTINNITHIYTLFGNFCSRTSESEYEIQLSHNVM